MSDAANNNSTEGEETNKVATSAATTTPEPAAATSEPPAESTENASSDNTSQPAIGDSELDNKQAEESMEVEESKAEPETVQNKDSSEDSTTTTNNANTTPAPPVESGDSEAVASSADLKTAGGDNSVTTTVSSNETKIKTESKDKRLKVDLSKAPVRQYLDATVVPILLGALSAVARERPDNPVEYLGNYLLEKSKEFPTD